MIRLDPEEKLKRIHCLMERTKKKSATQWIICLSKLIFNAAIRGIDNGDPTIQRFNAPLFVVSIMAIQLLQTSDLGIMIPLNLPGLILSGSA